MPKLELFDKQFIHYKRVNEEKKSETVIVFLHEALGSIGQWKNFPQQLCDALQLPGIIYERIGHGLSSPLQSNRNEDYLERYALDELPLVLENTLEKNQKAILIGHSDGGSIALLYAQIGSSKIKSIVTMAAHVINEKETLQGIAPAIKAYKKGKLDGLKKFHGDKTDTLFYAWADTWSAEFYKDWDICNKIDKVEVDALIIQGNQDQYGTEQQVDLILESIKSKRKHKLMLDACGHHPQLDKPDEVIGSIKQFLKA